MLLLRQPFDQLQVQIPFRTPPLHTFGNRGSEPLIEAKGDISQFLGFVPACEPLQCGLDPAEVVAKLPLQVAPDALRLDHLRPLHGADTLERGATRRSAGALGSDEAVLTALEEGFLYAGWLAIQEKQ
jgi:hypothetical protein